MGLSTNPFSSISLTLAFFFIFLSPCKAASSEITTLVYKGCANQTFPSDGAYTQTLSSLLDSLTSQSSKTKFFKTTSGGGGQTSISGLFQCRGDLNNNDCFTCVNKIPNMLNQLCGNTVAGRIQLNGCYLLYEISGFPQVSGFQMLFKTCGGSQAAGSGFEERRDTAFTQMENGISSSGSAGFYATSYQNMYVLGQCEGDLSAGDCSECVKEAVQKGQVECGSSISGKIYLHKCYMSYVYYPNGITNKGSSSDY